ncbi:MAG: AAA domain-containing protein, partial [Gemmataceae bacterium]|nr:AAA domain-containing protein [Gemmataceae bacterium]MDW8266168.1 AAA domain-containing protein [Gemmataceae bacterium]
RPETLPAASLRCTWAERMRQLREQTLTHAQADLVATEQELERRQQEASHWTGLRELAEAWRQLQAEMQQLACNQAHLAEQVENQAESPDVGSDDPLAVALRNCRAARDAQQQRLAAQRAELSRRFADYDARRHELTQQIEALRPLVASKRARQWWTATWWRATWAGNVVGRLSDLEARLRQCDDQQAELQNSLKDLEDQGELLEQTYQAERRRCIQAEVERRQAELRDREAALRREQEILEDKWRQRRQEITADCGLPSFPDTSALEGGERRWQALVDGLKQRRGFLRDWVHYLEQTSDQWAERLAGWVNVVAAPIHALPQDAHFGDRWASIRSFDRLVVEDAHLLSEADFVSLARRARRWVLIGPTETEVLGLGDGLPAGIARRGAPPRVALFHRLWNALHCDPRRWPTAWVREHDRLCCRLHVVPPEQRRWLESERVVDFPDIELRILAVPRTPPTIAEIVFPPTMSIAEAKAYLFRELQAVAIQGIGPSLRWDDEGDRLVLRVSEGACAETMTVPLAAGVRELLGSPLASGGRGEAGSVPWRTCRLEFDRGAGWRREDAEAWVAQHLGIRDSRRTALLRYPHRLSPSLAAFVAEVVLPGSYGRSVEGQAASGLGGAVEWLPVPRESPPRRDDKRPGGAGLEVDLSDPRQRERLSPELRSGLSDRGWVNPTEAHAVVRRLEALAHTDRRAAPGSVAVIALSSPQAEILRRLIASSAAASALKPVVDVPGALRHHEYPVVLVSLTRSPTHRAATFGETPRDLVVALTRAQERLIILGDPGAVARRVHWQGALDPWDEVASAQERELLARLLRWVQGAGRRPAREGSRA